MTFIFFTFDILTHVFQSFIHPYPTHTYYISVWLVVVKKTNDETFFIGILYTESHHMTKSGQRRSKYEIEFVGEFVI